MKYTAKPPPHVKSWDRIRFRASLEDYRSVEWPPPGPYWCSGEGYDYSIVVAYVPHGMHDADLYRYWPEMTHLDRMQEDVPIAFSDRFPKPDWWLDGGAK